MRTAKQKATRSKLSTTVARETLDFLEGKVASGEVATIAEAIDAAIRKVRQMESRQRLALATARYFNDLEPRAASEENDLARDMALPARVIDFDKEL